MLAHNGYVAFLALQITANRTNRLLPGYKIADVDEGLCQLITV